MPAEPHGPDFTGSSEINAVCCEYEAAEACSNFKSHLRRRNTQKKVLLDTGSVVPLVTPHPACNIVLRISKSSHEVPGTASSALCR